ncbi:MAG: glutamate 5-kinase [Pseudomonadota bacterium]
MNASNCARPDAAPWVFKLGSALLASPDGVNRSAIALWCAQIAAALAARERVVVVSSGAVAAGAVRLGLPARLGAMRLHQAAAAVGQLEVMNAYADALAEHERAAAMVLLTHADISNRARYLNARDTLTSLLDMGVVPIINENDSVATEEIRFGDNDRLAALVTNLLGARQLVLLTDQAGLHERDPRVEPDAPLVREARVDDPRLVAMAGGAGERGRGGMASKVDAARLAARSGVDTVIACGAEPDVITRLIAGEAIGTRLTSNERALDARKRWILGQQHSKGRLILDAGAVAALRERGVSLLPVGVTAVSGEFERGDLVQCLDPAGVAVAQGLSNFNSRQAAALCGRRDSASVLGYPASPELLHRDNLVVFD